MTHSNTLQLRDFISSAHFDRMALEYGDEQYTYAELLTAVDARIAQFASQVAPRAVVALQRKRSAAYVIDVLATLALGGVAMPIDPDLPQARKLMMLNTVLPQAMVHENGAISAVEPAPTAQGSAAHPAYVMFTSGSTGRPKAILGGLPALLNFINWQQKEFNVGPQDRVSFLTPTGFDVSLRDIFLPLLSGATLVIPKADDVVSPLSTAAWITAQKITMAHAVPSVAKLWGRAIAGIPTSLTNVFLAGEKLFPAVVRELQTSFGEDVEFVNLYGPSETTLAKYFHRIDHVAADATAPIPVGRPLPGAGCTFVQGTSKGEVILSTPDASLGYLGASAQDTARFSHNNMGIPTYRTGDLGELDEKGRLVILGRVDDEVKINGVRVHPNEVTEALSNYPHAQDVAVVTTGTDSPRLTAFWVAKPGTNNLASTAPRDFALTQLPQAIVPTIWRRVEALPKNANGKVDSLALRARLTLQPQINTTPATPTETWLMDQVTQILECDVPGPAADLFSLGATSLHIAFLIGKIDEELGKTLGFATLFATSKLSDIAALIDAAPRRQSDVIPALPSQTRYKLSPQQRRWWNIYMPEGNRSWATMVRIMRFDRSLDPIAVGEGLLDMALAQDSMRLFFQHSEDEIALRQHPVTQYSTIPVKTHDFGDQSHAEAEQALDALRLSVANSEIDTQSWPLYRAHLAHMPDGQTALVFAMHHMVSDGYSMALIEDTLRAYLVDNTPVPIPTQFNYLDYADWATQEEPQRFGENSAAQSYWGQVFDTPYAKHVFPERWVGRDHDRGQGYCRQIPQDLRTTIQGFAKTHKLTEFSVYFAAKFMALHHILKRQDLVIGTPAAGREVKGVEALVGNFISLVSIRSQGAEDNNLQGFVREIMHGVAQAMTHQGYQYDTLVRSLDIEFEQARFPLTTMFISYLNFGGTAGFNPAEEGFSDLGFAVKFDLMSYVREHNGATSLSVQYRNNLFYKQEIETFVDVWIDQLRKIVEEPRVFSRDMVPDSPAIECVA